MIKRMNTVFFAMCFLIALMGEMYSIIRLGDYFSIIGIGIVVLLIGYLMLDSFRSDIKKFNRDYTETDSKGVNKDEEIYEKLMTIQKATYTATKKSETATLEQIKELQKKLNQIENTMISLEQQIDEIKKNSLDK
jgi:general stress protein CsbA